MTMPRPEDHQRSASQVFVEFVKSWSSPVVSRNPCVARQTIRDSLGLLRGVNQAQDKTTIRSGTLRRLVFTRHVLGKLRREVDNRDQDPDHHKPDE